MHVVPRLPAEPRVISLVPSWTETLLETGVRVVGRSRFCIHPPERVAEIPVVGGTKDVKWDKVRSLRPDLLVLDREENTREMAEESPVPVIATHVRSISDCGRDLRVLANAFGREETGETEGGSARDRSGAEAGTVRGRLEDLAERWDRVDSAPAAPLRDWEEFPGVLTWWQRPLSPPSDDWGLVYLIWQDPWMAVRPETFIGSVLRKVGLGPMHARAVDRVADPGPYPVIDPTVFPADRTVLLCSSEPYPFARRPEAAVALGFPAALVDGEAFSWFGCRSLRFLESQLELP